MHISRRHLLNTCAALSLGAALPAWAQASADVAGFPRKAIAMVIPYPAGGPSDASGRIYADVMTKQLGQTVVVENIGGGTGVIGANRVLNAPADGYSLFQGSGNDTFLAPMLNPSVKFSPNDFRSVIIMSEATLVLVVRNGLPGGSLDEFLNYAKANKDKPLTYATVGIDSQYHLMGDALGKLVGVEFLHVPYKGSAPALQDLGGGQVDFAILAYQASIDGMAQQKRLQLVSSFSKTLPEPIQHIPLISASKLVPNFEHTIAGGYFVHKATPEPIMARLREAIAAAVMDKGIRGRLEAEGRVIHEVPKTQAEVDARMNALTDRYRQLIVAVGRKPLK